MKGVSVRVFSTWGFMFGAVVLEGGSIQNGGGGEGKIGWKARTDSSREDSQRGVNKSVGFVVCVQGKEMRWTLMS